MFRNRLAAIGTMVLLAWVPSAAYAQFVIGANFTGSTYAQQSFFFPPDTMGAIGPNHFVETLNGSFRVYDRTGVPLLSKSLDQFWMDATGTSPNQGSFDPRILYDPNTDRWFTTALDNPDVANNAILVAVSQTPDPTGAWTGFRIGSDSTQSHWADFDTLGMNGQGIYVAVNAFKTSAASDGITVVAINKANLVAGSLTGTIWENNNPNDLGFSVQPVVDTTGGGTPENLYSAYNAPVGLFKLSTITGPNEGNTLNVAGGFISVTPYNDPPFAHQPGGLNPFIDSGDSRLGSNLVRVGGNVWGVETVNSGGRSALRWFRIDPNTNTIAEEGIIGDATHDYYDGSIAVNNAGDVVIGYTRSGDTEYASSYASTGFFNGVSTTFAAPMLLKAGVASYSAVAIGRNRWGDYSATMVDPTDPTHFWTIQEWASAYNIWSTQITELVKGPGQVVPVSGLHTTLIGTGLMALGWLRRRKAARA